MRDKEQLLDEAQRRRRRIIEDRVDSARSLLRSHYGYGREGINLLTAFVDLLVDVFHLARKDQQSFTLDEAVSLAAQLYRAERPEAVSISEEPEAPPKTGQASD
jgi:hypothetical protein